jgi:copper chaperone
VKFSMKTEIHSYDLSKIEHAMKSVDADAKVAVDVGAQTVSVDSWLMPEEFLVAFYDEDLDVGIAEW